MLQKMLVVLDSIQKTKKKKTTVKFRQQNRSDHPVQVHDLE